MSRPEGNLGPADSRANQAHGTQVLHPTSCTPLAPLYRAHRLVNLTIRQFSVLAVENLAIHNDSVTTQTQTYLLRSKCQHFAVP